MIVVHILAGLVQVFFSENDAGMVISALYAFDLAVLSTYYFWESRKYASLKRSVKPREDDQLVDSLGAAGKIAIGFVHRFTELFFVIGVYLRSALAT